MSGCPYPESLVPTVFFAGQSMPAAGLNAQDQYITLEYDQTFHHWTPEGHTRAGTLKLALKQYAEDFVNHATPTRAASRVMAPAVVV